MAIFAIPPLVALLFACSVLPARVERLEGARFRVTVSPPLYRRADQLTRRAFNRHAGFRAIRRGARSRLPTNGEHEANVGACMARVNALIKSWVRPA